MTLVTCTVCCMPRARSPAKVARCLLSRVAEMRAGGCRTALSLTRTQTPTHTPMPTRTPCTRTRARPWIAHRRHDSTWASDSPCIPLTILAALATLLSVPHCHPCTRIHPSQLTPPHLTPPQHHRICWHGARPGERVEGPAGRVQQLHGRHGGSRASAPPSASLCSHRAAPTAHPHDERHGAAPSILDAHPSRRSLPPRHPSHCTAAVPGWSVDRSGVLIGSGRHSFLPLLQVSV